MGEGFDAEKWDVIEGKGVTLPDQAAANSKNLYIKSGDSKDDWTAKKDEESHDAKKPNRLAALFRRRATGGHRFGPLRRLRATTGMKLLRNYAPFILLLLLAPLMSGPIVFENGGGEPILTLPYYFVILPVTALLCLLYLWLRPVGDTPFFRFAALCLPFETYFMLRGASRRIALPLVLLVAGALLTLLYRFLLTAQAPPPSTLDELQQQLDPKEIALAEKTLRRKLLRFGVVCAAILFLFPIVQTAAPTAEADAVAAVAIQEETPFTFAGAMAEIAKLSPERWAHLTRAEKAAAMQALLDAETHEENMPALRLTDREIYNLKSNEALSIKWALRSGKRKMDQRIQSVCFAVYCKKISYVINAVSLNEYEAGALNYARERCAFYTAEIEKIR